MSEPNPENRLKDTETPVVMIVDDILKNIQVVGKILRENLDCDFTFANSGEEALRKIQKYPPDLILLDIMMPGMDGYEVCAKLKAEPSTLDIPIIFLTAKTETNDIVKGFEFGAVDYVTKPFNASELLARVKTQLSIREKNELIQSQGAEQRELLHILCHDLANPFCSILGFLNMTDDFETFKSVREHMISSTEGGLEVIDLVRKMRKIEDKDEPLEIDEYELKPLIAESEMMLREKIAAKRINLKINASADLKVKVEPVSFVNSVLNNLLTNAIKFSFPDSDIIIEAEPKDSQVELRLQDFGMGIPPVLVKDLFNLKKSTSRVGTEGETGTGFGMPLVKKFIKAYGGKIEVQSLDQESYPEEHGTIVIIELL